MSDSGSAQGPGGGRRPPKVGVYVPRHRRNNDETSAVAESSDSRQSSTASSPRQQHSSKNQRDNNMPKEDSTEEGNSSRSGHSSGGEVQRRGRGKFMGPGGSGSTSSGGHGGGNTRGHRDNRNGGTGTSSNSNNGSNSSTASPSQQPVPSVPRHPRGRDFDATVLRRYSDDENKPGSSFSRSSSYSSNRSNNSSNNNGGVLSPMHSSSTRPAGRSHDSSNTKRSDRADEGAWRRDDPKKAEDQDREQRSSSRTDVESESDLSNQLNRIQLSEDSDKKDETESVEELEEWELALQDSDEDAIPRIENSTASKSAKPHPAEHLLSSSASKAPKTGNWSEVANEEMYILELYDFSPAIKTMHLTDMFAPYENRSGGFRIKWIDDTKALVIFESAAVAKQAYIANLTNQIAKIKPYNGADKDIVRSAGNPSSGAYNGVRPAKTDSVARRLVQGALGLRVRRTPEQIAEEKALVQAAKEAREAQRQEQQRQRQEMDAVFDS